MKKSKNYKASILVSTIMILSVIMVTVLSTMYISVISRNASTNSNESLVAYQRADMGVEIALSAIVQGYTKNPSPSPPASPYDSAKKYTTGYWLTSGVGTCNASNGLIEKGTGNNAEYRIQLYERVSSSSLAYKIVACNHPIAFSKITRIKSVGVLPGKAQRAIGADVPIPKDLSTL